MKCRSKESAWDVQGNFSDLYPPVEFRSGFIIFQFLKTRGDFQHEAFGHNQIIVGNFLKESRAQGERERDPPIAAVLLTFTVYVFKTQTRLVGFLSH